MLFGNPRHFAIEAYHEPSGPEWGGFGRLCLLIQGVSVGDIRDNHCSLFAIADRFRHYSGVIGDLWTPCFTGLSDAEIFRLIDHNLYSHESSTDLRLELGRFDFLTNSAEMLDNIKTFLFCEPHGVVHFLYQLADQTLGSMSMSIASFRKVATTFVGWFDEQVKTTAPPFFPVNPFDPSETAVQ